MTKVKYQAFLKLLNEVSCFEDLNITCRKYNTVELKNGFGGYYYIYGHNFSINELNFYYSDDFYELKTGSVFLIKEELSDKELKFVIKNIDKFDLRNNFFYVISSKEFLKLKF